MNRLKYLKFEIEHEQISLSELAELDEMARQAGVKITDEMLAMDIINELEARADSTLDSGVHALMSVQDEAGRVVKNSKATWNTELWCNGELQVQKQLTASQVQEIKKLIERIK